jgi:hypothetical protein
MSYRVKISNKRDRRVTVSGLTSQDLSQLFLAAALYHQDNMEKAPEWHKGQLKLIGHLGKLLDKQWRPYLYQEPKRDKASRWKEVKQRQRIRLLVEEWLGA